MLKIFLVVFTAANAAPTITEKPSLAACWAEAQAIMSHRAAIGAGCAVQQ